MLLFNWNFQLFWLIFCYPADPFYETDSDLGGRNETDPSGSGSETLVVICLLCIFFDFDKAFDFNSFLKYIPLDQEMEKFGRMKHTILKEGAKKIKLDENT